MTSSPTAASYDAVAHAYADASFRDRSMRDAVATFAARLAPCSRVLDLGCGPGVDADTFVRLGHRVLGVDFSSAMIEEARRRVPDAVFVCADLVDVELDVGAFDAVWSVGVVRHLGPVALRTVLTAARRAARRGASGFVSMKCYPSGQVHHVEAGRDIFAWSRQALVHQLETSRWTVTRSAWRASNKPPAQRAPHERWLDLWLHAR